MILLQKKYIIKLDKKINDNISEIATFWPLSVKFISEHR
jgi:5'(3')-deoxyribonucleotidase